jgi:hypothetical protein
MKEEFDMEMINSGTMTSQEQQDPTPRLYERPELRELGTVEDLTWEGSEFNVGT